MACRLKNVQEKLYEKINERMMRQPGVWFLRAGLSKVCRVFFRRVVGTWNRICGKGHDDESISPSGGVVNESEAPGAVRQLYFPPAPDCAVQCPKSAGIDGRGVSWINDFGRNGWGYGYGHHLWILAPHRLVKQDPIL